MSIELAVLERQILAELCRSKMTTSAVAFAADLPGGGLSYQLVEFVLEGLNALGLVTYRLGVFDVFCEIRVTRLGYETMGYEHHAEVGSRQARHREMSRHPGDNTDFRNHGDFAVVLESKRCSLEDHLGEFPDHRYSTPGGF